RRGRSGTDPSARGTGALLTGARGAGLFRGQPGWLLPTRRRLFRRRGTPLRLQPHEPARVADRSPGRAGRRREEGAAAGVGAPPRPQADAVAAPRHLRPPPFAHRMVDLPPPGDRLRARRLFLALCAVASLVLAIGLWLLAGRRELLAIPFGSTKIELLRPGAL